MTGENDHVTESVNLEGCSESKNMILLESTIEDAKNRKELLSSTMDSVISLMREVEHREKVAQQAVENIGRSSLDVLAKVEELKQAQISAFEANQTRAKEIYAERDVLGAKMDALQMSVAGLLTMGGSSVGVLDEIGRSLEIRLISALAKREEAENLNRKLEAVARNALAYEERQMENVVQESERLKSEAVKNSKMNELLTRHGDEVNSLRESMTHKWQNVSQLNVKLDLTVLVGDTLSCCQTPCKPEYEINRANEMTHQKRFGSEGVVLKDGHFGSCLNGFYKIGSS